jgi:arylsulfatase A-like enzyme
MLDDTTIVFCAGVASQPDADTLRSRGHSHGRDRGLDRRRKPDADHRRREAKKYVRCALDPEQLFNLAADPDELTNRAGDPAHAAMLARFHAAADAR